MSNYSVFINGKENENWDEVIKIEIINKSGYCWTIPIEEIQTLTIKNLEENKMSELKLEVGKKYNLNMDELYSPATLLCIVDDDMGSLLFSKNKSHTFLTIRNKIISEYTEPEKLKLERVTVFQEGGAIYAKHLNAEFNNIIDYINSKFNVGEGLNG